jgi:hypothetical protein
MSRRMVNWSSVIIFLSQCIYWIIAIGRGILYRFDDYIAWLKTFEDDWQPEDRKTWGIRKWYSR